MWWLASVNSLFLIAAMLIDVRWRRIPHGLTISGCVVALVGSAMISAETLIAGILGLLTGFTLFFVIYLLARRHYNQNGLGFGDVMLAAMIGAMLGPLLALWVLAVGLLLAGLVAGWRLWRGQVQRQTSIAFGPFLVLPALVALWL
jgi:prepilin signal peptidase PulO-like enzyme (type II secretory pathway)